MLLVLNEVELLVELVLTEVLCDVLEVEMELLVDEEVELVEIDVLVD